MPQIVIGASVCGLDPQTNDLYAASGRGFLTGSDGSIEGTIAVYCMKSPPTFWGDANVTYEYDVSHDTIIDLGGVVWNRR